jgi:DNA invertase Pin-like site-specific DNA recombinase
MSRTIGYLRVSTAEQDVEKNKSDILKLANDKKLGNVDWIEEKVTGTKNWRKRKFGEVFETLQTGDTLIVPELSRLGRSTLQILEIMKEAREKDVSVYAIKGGWNLNGSMESKIVLTMLAMMSEIERDLISERTKEGLRAVQAKGVRLGRPKGPGRSKLDANRVEIIALLNNGSTKAYVARRFETSQPNLYNWLKKNQIKIAA